jgi:phosphoglycolate phosphatase-like HAD superfamily hydrolase
LSTDDAAARRPGRQFDLIAFDWDGTLFDSTQDHRALHPAAVRGRGRHRAVSDKALAM